MTAANIETRKFEVISFITSLKKEETIEAFEKIIKKSQPKKRLKKQESSTSILSEAEVQYLKPPIRKTITADELALEQNWKGIDEKEMDAIAERINLQEPIEQLLAEFKAIG